MVNLLSIHMSVQVLFCSDAIIRPFKGTSKGPEALQLPLNDFNIQDYRCVMCVFFDGYCRIYLVSLSNIDAPLRLLHQYCDQINPFLHFTHEFNYSPRATFNYNIFPQIF